MLRLLNQFKKNLLKEGKIKSFIFYTIGEVFLVVLGIWIALQIDNWSEHQKNIAKEKEHYEDIILDLRKDSVMLQSRIARAKMQLDVYYELNNATQSPSQLDDEVFADFLVMTITFDPITQQNHQQTIQELEAQAIRNSLNIYFANEYRVREASSEFNELISQRSRPFFLEEMNAFNMNGVFMEEKYKFPPMMRKRTLDNDKIRKAMGEADFLPLVAQLRMSLGWFLIEIEDLAKENARLISTLGEKLK